MSNNNDNSTAKKKSFMEKWNDLTTVTKNIYKAIIAIPTLIGAVITIWSMITIEEPSSEFKDRINNLEFVERTEISHVLDSCANYKKKGFIEFLYKYEKMECRSETKDMVTEWFKKPNNKFNRRKYLKILFERSELLFNEYITDIVKNDEKLDGIYNYIDLYAYMGNKKKRKTIKMLNDWNRRYQTEANKVEKDYNNIKTFNNNIEESIRKITSN